MKNELILSNFITKQYDISKLKKMIDLFLQLVESFQIMLNDKSYYIKYSSNYEIRVGGSRQPTSSKIESFFIKEYNDTYKKEQLLLKYKCAVNTLSDIERQVFIETFVNKKHISNIRDELFSYNDKVILIKKSAIVKVSLSLGLDRFMDLF